ncbi:iron-sulfur cluster-binding protein [Marinobacter mobilis]|uniref:NAD(P)H-flavin reductase n=1 Tax=Marinobacter mobilis TaxID=488533 RepID=A0A1H2SNY0_9GAMM|nr:hypothetical protein [Marinobacter mobilis]SDW33165.1 NAD(P)H-flavin reductase [Marinobacter mobilis]
MNSLTPVSAELVEFYDDGEDARHFHFRLLDSGLWPDTQPGQFFMLSVPGVGEVPLTFTQLPDGHQHWWALVRKMGAVTGALFRLEPGAIVGARGPFGRGWPITTKPEGPALVIGGGCGLAPLVSLTDRLLESGQAPVALIYGARSLEARVLSRERARWQDQLALFEVVEHHPDHPGRQTPLDALPKILQTWGHTPQAAFLCGPEAMMTALGRDLIQRGIPEESIWLSLERRMHCAAGTCGHCYLKHRYVCQSGPTFSWVELQPLLPPTSDHPKVPLHTC